MCPPHRIYVSIMLAQGQGHSLYPWISSQAWKDIQYNSGDMLTLVRDEWLHHGTLISSSQLKHFYFQCATQFRPFRPLIYFYLSMKIRFDFSCESSAQQRIHLKHQVLFSLKNKEKIFMNVVCCSHDWRFKG